MKKKLFSNWGLKLLSLIVAFGLWLVVVALENPPDDKTFSNIPVTLTNVELLTDTNQVYEILDNTDVVKKITVNAPRDIISQLTKDDIVAVADVSKLTSINTIEIEFSVPQYKDDIDIEVSDTSSKVVKLQLDERKNKNVQLLVSTQGEVAEGYVLDSVTVDPNRIRISGAATKVNQVGYAQVSVDVTDISSKLSTRETIRLYDDEGNLIDDSLIDKTVNQANVTVSVLATKVVPISYTVTGEPAEGYRRTGVVESSVESVRIAGTASQLANISEITIPKEVLDITGRTESLVQSFNVRNYLPSGTKLAEEDFGGNITISVYIEQEVEKRLDIPASNIHIVNVPEGIQYEIVDDNSAYELHIAGLEVQTVLLNAHTMTGTVDVAAWMEKQNMEELTSGTYLLQIDFGLAEQITIKKPAAMRITFLKEEEIQEEVPQMGVEE